MSVSIDDEAFVIMQRERCEMEAEIAALREQRARMLKACWIARDNIAWIDGRLCDAIAYAEGADNA